MKLKQLKITSYRHLKNLIFDFTYPAGHIKAGKPLEKVCLIGQSATGKTSVLEIVKQALKSLAQVEVVNGTHLFKYFSIEFDGEIEFEHGSGPIIMKQNEITAYSRSFPVLPGSGGGTITSLITDDLKAVYLSSDIISKETIEILNQNPVTLANILTGEKFHRYTLDSYSKIFVHEFLHSVNEEIWFSLLHQILDYRKRFTQMAAEMISKGVIGDAKKLNSLFNLWASQNENPLASFAELFNPILEKLNLEIDLVNTEYSIPIKSRTNNEVIPISGLSTGTKALLLTMFLLFQFDTNGAVVLIDEPERSLFPDMQIDLISHYQRIAPNAQIVLATHSPFISAAFEPEERFILYFNEENEVAIRRGESPIGDDPNDLLRNDFKIDYYNDFGKNAYARYLDLKRQIIQEPEASKKDHLVLELSKLGDMYNF